uniref:chromosome segregation protein SMC n=1 Tax=Tepidanaerobacter syntrophicus TaxID=224999 RepID=UPI0024917C64|nr:chromosome segregation protein SMC [Tepidanaerobacter syntrophicus]
MELQGFKSFANRISLEFQPGINAIVGPNGSGKSNIVDAVRWALGEQSIKTLRGYKLEDVIFAGSSKRKPLGMAEVAITLDNSDNLIPLDYSEICFMRRTFRSGESEFYLNKTSCRLKDIQEILMDSGIGKDGYSIISQGQIDDILTCRPEERRAMLEETAGIAKYKLRKKEAEARLAETVNNVSRIDDIISEISSQLKPLAVQKDAALKYKELSLLLTNTEISLLVLQLEDREKRLAHIREKLDSKEKAILQLSSIIESLKTNLDDYKNRQNSIESDYEKAQKNFYEVSGKIKDLQKDFEMLSADKNRTLNENNKLLSDIRNQETLITAFKETFKEKSCELAKKADDINDTLEKLNTSENRLTEINSKITEVQYSISNFQGSIMQLLNDISEKRSTISNLTGTKSNFENRLKQIRDERKEIENTNKKILDKITDIESRRTQLEQTKTNLKKEIEHLENILKNLTENRNINVNAKTKKQQELVTLTAQEKTLAEIYDNYEDYQYGVKNLLLALKSKRYNDSRIHGTIADAISVDEQYEVAIETALGYAMQDIICENEESAKDAIEYLKKHGLGRATFLPLSVLKPRFLEPYESKIVLEDDKVLPAIELIKFDDKYYPALAFLLGRVLVAKTFEDALIAAKRCHFSLKIVTIQGEILSPGGSITGGSQNKSKFLLTRKRKLAEDRQKISKLNLELEKLDSIIITLNNKILDTQKQITEKNEHLNSIESEIATLNDELREKQLIFQERIKRKEQLEAEIFSINKKIQEITDEILLLENEIKNVDSQNLSGQDAVKQLQNELAELNKLRDDLSAQVTELKVKVASYNQEKINIEENLDAINDRINNCYTEIDKYRKKIGENDKLLLNINKEIDTCKKELKSFDAQCSDLQKLLESLARQKDEIKHQINNAQNKLNQAEREYAQGEKFLQNNKIEEAKILTELLQIKNELFERYNVSDPEVGEYDYESADKLKERLSSLKREIELLGPVNLKAIEDYENIKARYDFLKSQRDDLVKAKLDLDSLINEINSNMEAMLLETIEKVNREFNKVFSELFDGGSAELIIEGDANVLECGIELNVQPPGKRLQNISLLSGGEKALSAIALLFALLNIKSTPFCILDEIEAALDDANIARFTRYLKKSSANTQFIVITHRKPTMEIADALYGITMEDDATSKLLAVKVG